MASTTKSYHRLMYQRQRGELRESCFMREVYRDPSIVSRLSLDGTLRGHMGCVNTVAYSQDGTLLITGSDDTHLMVWDSETYKRKLRFSPGHLENVFSARFLPFSGNEEVVSCAADGQVRFSHLRGQEKKLLATHRGRAHRLCLEPGAARCFFSCGEDGVVNHYDLRSSRKTRLLPQAGSSSREVIYAMSVNNNKPHEFVVGGTSSNLKLYDRRRMGGGPAAEFCPPHLRDTPVAHITGCAYDYSGTEVVVTYNDELIYRFHTALDRITDGGNGSDDEDNDTSPLLNPAAAAAASSSSAAAASSDQAAATTATATSSDGDGVAREEGEDVVGDGPTNGYRRRFRGHRNDATVKQVNFWGPRSEYIVSGSDCGHIFIWSSSTGRLVQLLQGDRLGAINCLDGHPFQPALATSGLESNAKIWRPTAPKAVAWEDLKGWHGVSAMELMERNDRERNPDVDDDLTESIRLLLGRSGAVPNSDRGGIMRALQELMRAVPRNARLFRALMESDDEGGGGRGGGGGGGGRWDAGAPHARC